MSNLYPINCVDYCEYLEYSKDCYGTPFEFCDLCGFGCEKFCDLCGGVFVALIVSTTSSKKF